MTLVGVSRDDVDASREFAATYGIAFPLLADEAGAMSQAYVGIDGADNTIPGIVLIRAGGTIAFRQIATAKDDRLTAAQLLEVVDRTLGTSGAGIDESYGVLQRWQVRLAVGGGQGKRDVIDDIPTAWIGSGNVAAAILLPVQRYLLAGVQVGASNLEANASAVLGVRLPFLHDTAAVELLGSVGHNAWVDEGGASWIAGGRLGTWLAWTPRWAFTLDAGVEVRVGARESQPVVTGMLGVARLFEF